MPELDEYDFVASLEALVRADACWVSAGDGETSLYLRPFMFAAEAFLGVRPAERFVYAVIATPAGPYFSGGVGGLTLWVSNEYTRAAPGGTGAAKCGGNYAASLAAQVEAKAEGCQQVLHLDQVGGDGRLEESGTMNLFLITSDGELLTPGLGTILEGVTRDSVLTLAGRFGLFPVERSITVQELRTRAGNRTVVEAFAAGTAAVVTPIVAVKDPDRQFTIGDGRPGKRTLALREHLLDIQFGRAPDTHGWLHRVA
jgi:branched-chain amino acid aminotransferase